MTVPDPTETATTGARTVEADPEPSGRLPKGAKMSRSSRAPRGRGTRAGLVYGAAALTAAARGDRLFWALHKAALVRGLIPVAPACVVADAVRAAGGPDPLSEVLEGTEVEPLDDAQAIRLGMLAAAAGADNLATVAMVEMAARRNLAAVSERSSRLGEIAAALDHDLIMHAI